MTGCSHMTWGYQCEVDFCTYDGCWYDYDCDNFYSMFDDSWYNNTDGNSSWTDWGSPDNYTDPYWDCYGYSCEYLHDDL
jgi:hypothetical protein